ncbi:MAG: hypothetical protein JNN08_13355 [Bryobacterales bacterium]|nr:hypothetical protein [Bryobacterales bacterium]
MKRMQQIILLNTFLTLPPVSVLHAQSPPKWNSCPVVARLPADLKDTEPFDLRQWFELRQCGGGTVLVNGYERHRSAPSLSFDTGHGYPVQLVHILNVLVIESLGGSTNHAFVLSFLNGKPTVALKRSTAGRVTVQRNEKSVTVAVPVKTYPGPNGKFPSVPDTFYTFSLEQ